MSWRRRLADALAAVDGAEALILLAGAGMGVDSGLPDFRGAQGFWRAYPPMRALGLSFEDMADPRWFRDDPRLAWGFYGHRLALYRRTKPHRGYEILRRWVGAAPGGGFVLTSNVDGQFQAAGFDEGELVEVHGRIGWLQCCRPCTDRLWPAGEAPCVDADSMRAQGELPRCRRCGDLARPNILMFRDSSWVARRTAAQERTFAAWLADRSRSRLALIEVGAGRAVPTIRWMAEDLARSRRAPLIRINPREAAGPPGTISLATGARAALEALDEARRAHL